MKYSTKKQIENALNVKPDSTTKLHDYYVSEASDYEKLQIRMHLNHISNELSRGVQDNNVNLASNFLFLVNSLGLYEYLPFIRSWHVAKSRNVSFIFQRIKDTSERLELLSKIKKPNPIEIVKSYDNERLLEAMLYIAAGDDYDGSFSEEGNALYDACLMELRNRLRECGFLGKKEDETIKK